MESIVGNIELLGVNSNGAEAVGIAATVETAAVKNNVTDAKLNFIANGWRWDYSEETPLIDGKEKV